MQQPDLVLPPRPSFTRRDFLRTTALAFGAAATTGPYLVRGQNLNSKLNIAGIGGGGKGDSDIRHCEGENIVAICDAAEKHCAGARGRNPNAKFYRDYRKMFDEMGKGIDAVTVSTPDHNHAVAAGMAMKLGKHVYCQKPLTQTVYEARVLRDLAKRQKVVTQMGNQGSAEDGLRRAVECIQAGLIGPVRTLYVWSNRPVWPQGMPRPTGEDPVPADLDWDMWLGPAQLRPYKGDRTYHDFNWRGWVDFGTGALGDMACHTANMPFRALKLGYPTLIEAETSGFNGESYPLASKIRFEFPAREGLQPATFWWFDGGKPKANEPYRHDGSNKPPKEVTADVEALTGEVPGSGCLLIGDKGKIFSPDDYGAQFFLKLKDEKEFASAKNHAAVAAIPQSIPRNPTQGDSDKRQHLEWIKAIKDNNPELCYSRFDVAAYLTEIILLGCIAIRVGKKLDWDGPNMSAKNAPEAAKFVKPVMRPGWTLG
jgi:hypothetical protein